MSDGFQVESIKSGIDEVVVVEFLDFFFFRFFSEKKIYDRIEGADFTRAAFSAVPPESVVSESEFFFDVSLKSYPTSY